MRDLRSEEIYKFRYDASTRTFWGFYTLPMYLEGTMLHAIVKSPGTNVFRHWNLETPSSRFKHKQALAIYGPHQVTYDAAASPIQLQRAD